MRTLWIIFLNLSLLGLLLILKYLPASEILSHKPRIWKPMEGLQLEFVENENLTEIHILMTELNSSFVSLITVRYYFIEERDVQTLIYFVSFHKTFKTVTPMTNDKVDCQNFNSSYLLT